MALGKVLGGSWASNGPLQGLGRLLGSSWRVLVGLLGALGPSKGLLEGPAKLRGPLEGILGRSWDALGELLGRLVGRHRSLNISRRVMIDFCYFFLQKPWFS